LKLKSKLQCNLWCSDQGQVCWCTSKSVCIALFQFGGSNFVWTMVEMAHPFGNWQSDVENCVERDIFLALACICVCV
jgi:hypothetical protein